MNEALEILYKAFSSGAEICTDSRNIPPDCIFFALKGERFDGNDYALWAVEEGGAEFAVADRPALKGQPGIFFVPDALQALQQLAEYHRQQMDIPLIAVTGSNGKTTTKELLNRVLSKKYRTLCTVGNLNNHIGVPLTLLNLESAHELAIIEMGANHQKEIELLCSIAHPTHVLITNVGKAHLEGFGGFEGVKKGKGEMYEYARNYKNSVFINSDNQHLASMLGNYAHTVSYGTSSNSDITGKIVQHDGSHVWLEWKTKESQGWNQVKSKITGAYNFENILSAIAAGVHFGVAESDITSAIESYSPDNQRSQEMQIGDNHIILDAYNANPTSMEAALKNFSSNFSGKRAVFLGDMFELGESSIEEHKGVIEKVLSQGYDQVVLVGPVFSEVAVGNINTLFKDSEEAAAWLRQNPLHGYNILIKGSRGSKMEKMLEALK
jgi:UDP-N-acetylmuramoyl-tripeptide--D-alanyl-D-alanine ligase